MKQTNDVTVTKYNTLCNPPLCICHASERTVHAVRAVWKNSYGEINSWIRLYTDNITGTRSDIDKLLKHPCTMHHVTSLNGYRLKKYTEEICIKLQ